MNAREALFAQFPPVDEPTRSEASAALRERRSRLSWAAAVGGAERFEQNAIVAGAAVVRTTRAAAAAWFVSHAAGTSGITLADDPLIAELGLEDALRTAFPGMVIRHCGADETFDARAYNSSGIGVTCALAGIADSGAIVASVSRDENRSVSLLPDEHVAFLPLDRIVPSLHATVPLLSRLIQQDQKSAVTLIGGPSKTADIEKVLVTGVHGPGALTIVLIEAT